MSSSSSSDITHTQKYKGVRKRTWGKYVSEIRLPNSRERIWLGSYDSAIKAARAFDAALFCLRGSSASFNFPDNPPDIPGGRSLNAAEIQIAASRFANCDPNPSDSPSICSEMQPETESPSMQPAAYYDGMDNGSLWNEFTNIPAPEADPFHSSVFPDQFDDFSNGYFPPPPEQCDYYMEDNNGESQGGLFLWNF